MTILRYTFILLRSRWMINWNSFVRGSVSRKVGIVAMLLFVGLLGWGLYNLTNGIVELFTSDRFNTFLNDYQAFQRRTSRPGSPGVPQLDFEALRSISLDILPNIFFILLFFSLILSSFATTLSGLYLSNDLEFLLAAPVPMRSVFLAKFLTTLFGSSAMFVLVGFPALVGFGRALNYGPLYYLLLPLVPFVLALIPVGLGGLLVMLLVRFVPARRLREVLTVVGGLIFALFYLFSQLLTVRGNPVSGAFVYGSSRVFRYLDDPYLPSTWAGQALVSAGTGRWGELVFNLGLLLLLGGVIFGACLIGAEELYYSGWTNFSTVPTVRKSKRKTNEGDDRAVIWSRLTGFVPRPLNAVMVKDWKIAARDPQNLTQFFMPVAMIVVLVIQGQQTARFIPSQFASGLAVLGTGTLSLFISSIIFSRFALAAVSREARSFWLIRVAPLSIPQLLFAKFLSVYIPFAGFASVVVLVLSIIQRQHPANMLLTTGFVLVGSAGITAINLGFGAAFPRFDWDNPNRQTSTRAGCLSPLAYFLYTGILISLFAIPQAIAPLISDLLYEALLWLACVASAIVLTGTIIWSSFSIATSSLAKIDL